MTLPPDFTDKTIPRLSRCFTPSGPATKHGHAVQIQPVPSAYRATLKATGIAQSTDHMLSKPGWAFFCVLTVNSSKTVRNKACVGISKIGGVLAEFAKEIPTHALFRPFADNLPSIRRKRPTRVSIACGLSIGLCRLL